MKCFKTAILLLVVIGFKSAIAQASNSVILTPKELSQDIGLHLEYLLDPTTELTIADIQSALYQDRFVSNTESNPNFGITEDAVWLRFNIDSQLAAPSQWYLLLDFIAFNDIQVFHVSSGQALVSYQAGDLHEFSTRPINHRHFFFPLTIEPSQSSTVYLRIQTLPPMNVSLKMMSEQTFQTYLIEDSLNIGWFYGVILVAIFFNGFLGVFTRDRSYFFYIAYVFLVGSLFFVRDGLASQYLYPEHPQQTVYVVIILAWLALTNLLLFTQMLLKTQSNTPKLHRIMSYIIKIFPIVLIMVLFVSYRIGGPIFISIPVSTIIICFSTGILIWHQGYAPARFFTIGWIMMFAGALIYFLQLLGFLPHNVFTRDFVKIGIVLEVILFSLALANRITLLQKDKDAAHAQALLKEKQTQFYQFIAHELRTPVTSVQPYFRFLKKGIECDPPTPSQLKFLNHIETDLQRLSKMVRQSMELAHLKSVPSIQSVHPFDPNPLIKKTLQHMEPLIHPKLTLNIEIQESNRLILGTEEHLITILENLVINAVKYTEQGIITVKTEITDAGLKLLVIDSGIGIDQEHIQTIFDEFKQLDSSKSGVGLGLKIVKETAKNMNATLDAKSEIGHGSEFGLLMKWAP